MFVPKLVCDASYFANIYNGLTLVNRYMLYILIENFVNIPDHI